MLNWLYIWRNPLYYKVFGSRHISVGDAQKHLSSANVKQWKILEHNEKITFKNMSLWTMQSIQIWKNMLVCMTYFVFFWVFTNSVQFKSYSIILYHTYLNKRKRYFKNIFSRSSCLGLISLNVLPTCLFSKTSL